MGGDLNLTGILASVSSLEEARILLNYPIDIIDLKNPSEGALGAVRPETLHSIIQAVGQQVTTSATIGDLAMLPEVIIPAIETTARSQVDYIKMGFFPEGDPERLFNALYERGYTTRFKLILVCFGDHPLPFEWIDRLANWGFAGLMLDTANKTEGSLTKRLDLVTISRFIGAVRQHKLLCGLAGSLGEQDIDALVPLNPDYLGFRGALCFGNRTGQISELATESILARLRSAHFLPSGHAHV
jgi:uncharacterized protein (UPF0264 family)